jgi:hypothetical protein
VGQKNQELRGRQPGAAPPHGVVVQPYEVTFNILDGSSDQSVNPTQNGKEKVENELPPDPLQLSRLTPYASEHTPDSIARLGITSKGGSRSGAEAPSDCLCFPYQNALAAWLPWTGLAVWLAVTLLFMQHAIASRVELEPRALS